MARQVKPRYKADYSFAIRADQGDCTLEMFKRGDPRYRSLVLIGADGIAATFTGRKTLRALARAILEQTDGK